MALSKTFHFRLCFHLSSPEEERGSHAGHSLTLSVSEHDFLILRRPPRVSDRLPSEAQGTKRMMSTLTSPGGHMSVQIVVQPDGAKILGIQDMIRRQAGNIGIRHACATHGCAVNVYLSG